MCIHRNQKKHNTYTADEAQDKSAYMTTYTIITQTCNTKYVHHTINTLIYFKPNV